MEIDIHKIVWGGVALYLIYYLIKLMRIQIAYSRKRRVLSDSTDGRSETVDFQRMEQDARSSLSGDELEQTLSTIEQLRELQESTNELMQETKETTTKTNHIALLMILGITAGIAYSLFKLVGSQ